MSTTQTQTRTHYAADPRTSRTSRGTASSWWAPLTHSHSAQHGHHSSMAPQSARESVPIKGFQPSMMPQDYPPQIPSYPEGTVPIRLTPAYDGASDPSVSRSTKPRGSSHYSMRGPYTQSSHTRKNDDRRRWEDVKTLGSQPSHTHLGPSIQAGSNLKSSLKPQVRIMEPSASSQAPSVEDDLRAKLASVTSYLRSTEKELTETRTALFQKMQEEEDMTDYAVKLRKTVENQNSEIAELKHYEDLAKKSRIRLKEIGDRATLAQKRSEYFENKLDFYRRGLRQSVAGELEAEVASRMKMSSRGDKSED